MATFKVCGKRRNCSLRAISPFPTVFSNACLSEASKGVIVWGWVKGSRRQYINYLLIILARIVYVRQIILARIVYVRQIILARIVYVRQIILARIVYVRQIILARIVYVRQIILARIVYVRQIILARIVYVRQIILARIVYVRQIILARIVYVRQIIHLYKNITLVKKCNSFQLAVPVKKLKGNHNTQARF